MRPPASFARRGAWTLGLLLLAGSVARADWMQPDPSYREAQMIQHMAARDTAGHGADPGRLDSLGVALLRLARLGDAEKILKRSLAVSPADPTARAGLGKIALFRDRLAEAESLLTGIEDDPSAANDLLATRIRRGEYAAAAEIAGEAQQEGRAELLKAMVGPPVYAVTKGPAVAKIPWVRAFPVPLVRVQLNGTSVLMAIDTGTNDLLLDRWAVRRCKVQKLAATRSEFWCGSRVAVANVMVQRLEIGGLRIERVPAGEMSLHKWSLEVNPMGEQVAGVIGLGLLRQFTPTIDYPEHVLELRRPGTGYAPKALAQRVPFEIWGEAELTVYGSLAGGRRMALVVQSGVPSCGVGAPSEVFDELGVKPGMMSRIAKGAGQWLQGRPWAAVVVPSVTIGSMTQDKVQGWSGALDSSELWRHGVRRDALIAGDAFRDWRITIDWQAHELVIED